MTMTICGAAQIDAILANGLDRRNAASVLIELSRTEMSLDATGC
jgi:hypothetical protein